MKITTKGHMKLIGIVLPFVLWGCGSMPSPYLPGRSNPPDFEKIRERALEDNRKEAERQAEWEAQAPARATQQAAWSKAMERAAAERKAKFNAMMARIALLDLSKPVFIMSGSLICPDKDSLLPAVLFGLSAEEWIRRRGPVCIVSEKTSLPVIIFLRVGTSPEHPDAVLVGRRSEQMSDGRLLTGWVAEDRLTNLRESSPTK